MIFSLVKHPALVATVGVFMSQLAMAQFDSPMPAARVADEYLALLMKGSYGELERATVNARKSGATMADGQPLLAAIYAGTAGCGGRNRLTDELWKACGQRLADWRTRYPDSVAAKVAVASFSLHYGWFARGGGTSNTVSAEGWALFKERVAKAHADLEALDEPAKHDPGWFDAMLKVARSEGWPKARYEALYEQAAREHPLYLPIHFEGGAYYSPLWYGSWPEFRQFVDRAVERTRDQWGETLYARLTWASDTTRMFMEGQLDWPRMRSGFERMIRDYPDPWNTNNYVKFACQAQDWQTVTKLMPLIGGKPIAEAWYQDLQIYSGCRNHAEQVMKSMQQPYGRRVPLR